MSEETKLIEHLAHLEHERWSGWHKYARANWTPENIAMWDRKANTPYSELKEFEKVSDRKEVAYYFNLLATSQKEIIRYKEELTWAKRTYTEEQMRVSDLKKAVAELVEALEYYEGKMDSEGRLTYSSDQGRRAFEALMKHKPKEAKEGNDERQSRD